MNGPLGAFRLTENDARHLGGEFSAGRVGFASSLPISIQAYLAWSFHDTWHKPIIWVVDTTRNLDLLAQDLAALGGPRAHLVSCFPALEILPGAAPRSGQRMDVLGDRLTTLQNCARAGGPAIIATCIQALVQPTPSPAWLERHSMQLEVSREADPDALVRTLAESGYRFEAEVQEKGQASLRGGLLDVWPPTHPWPFRLEFFGPVLDSIRTFDPADQRSLEHLNAVTLAPAAEEENPEPAGFLSYLPADALFAWSEPDSLAQHLEMYRATLPEKSPARDDARFEQLRLVVSRRFTGGEFVCGVDPAQSSLAHEPDLHPVEGVPAVSGGHLHPDLMEEARHRFILELRRQAQSGRHVYFFLNTGGSRDRFLELYDKDLAGVPNIHHTVSPLTEGFQSDPLGFTIVAESDLYGFRKRLPGRYDLHAPARTAGTTRAARETGQRLADWTDIQPGELVVHMDHGIGKYLGLYDIDFQGRQQEVLAIEYADKARLYVPVSQAHLLSRYVGIGRRRPDLHALGGKRWTREKLSAERAVRDLASSLIETQAHRDALDGHAFTPDTAWQHEFEAAFPFQETEDQHNAIVEVKKDMESRRPMDRLICGDVGYGKTEVAMRAAFKAVMDGRQVALLVPTTILAQQHYDTFTERMAAYPVAIEMLSRFRTRAEQHDAVRRVNAGSVDIVIGTHRLLQKDVKFHDLGLVIVDEEQRFGVVHKEHLKHLRELVDVLTLTATPIPRTLYMSLTGAKDMSTIQTPPQDRLPVETLVVQNNDDIVRSAILRELNRGGQIYYLHNRVTTIYAIRDRLRRLVPEARIEVGHGQMHERELADVMHRFVRGEFDILLCTTIIESGVDIPNVNTILIDRADRFGMADLYQLRGRVGRYKHKAYAYLLLPRHGQLFDNARKRISAIRRYSSLGAGFKLALRDLEIRGAGNLLGSQQSGHIAAVGFDLYCQLLKRTVARLRNEPAAPIIDAEVKLDFLDLSPAPGHAERAAAISASYIEDENLRLAAYRKIAAAVTEPDIDAIAEDFRDRFGPLPMPTERLLQVARLRIVASTRRLQSIETREGKVMMMRDRDYLMTGSRFPRLISTDPSACLDELLALARKA